MKYIIPLLLLLTPVVFVFAQSEPIVNSAYPKKTSRYFLRYYFEDAPDKVLWNRIVSRVVGDAGAFCLLDYDVKDNKRVVSRACYDQRGIPKESESGKDFIKVFQDSIRLSFMGRDTTLFIKGVTLRNPIMLWFWKYHPKKMEEVVVAGVRRNFITKKIDRVEVSYVYLGKDRIDVMGKTGRYHLVRSRQVDGNPAVYDDSWYDDKGMMVKEKHVVGNAAPRIGVLAKIME